MRQTYCLKSGGIYGTVGHAKSACSKNKRCVGIQNPNCDSLSSHLCLNAVYQNTKLYETRSYELYNYYRDVISNKQVHCTYIKDERYGKTTFKVYQKSQDLTTLNGALIYEYRPH